MALTFSGTGQHLEYGTTALISAACSFSCWINIPSLPSGNATMMSVSSTTAQSLFEMYVSSTGHLNAAHLSGGVLGTATSTATITPGTWYHCAAVFASGTSRTIYLNAVGATNTTSVGTVVANRTSIGCAFAGTTTAAALFPGTIAYPAFWTGGVLTSTDATSLYNGGSGVDPRTVEAGSLLGFLTLDGGAPYVDTVNSTTMTVTGSPTTVADPFSLSSGSTFAFVQYNQASGTTNTSLAVTNASAATVAGDLIVVTVSQAPLGVTIQTVSVADTVNGSYTQAIAPNSFMNEVSQCIFYFSNSAAAAAGTNTITATFGGTATNPEVRMTEYTAGGAVTVDVTNGASGAAGTTQPSGSITATAGDLLVGGNCCSNTTTGSGAGWTQAGQTPGTDVDEYQLNVSAGSYQATFAGASPGDWVSQIVSFKSGGSGTPINATTAITSDTVLTLLAQLGLKGVTSIPIATLLSFTPKLTEQDALSINSAINATLGGIVDARAAISILSGNSLLLVASIMGQTVAATVSDIIGNTLTLNSRASHSAVIFI